MARTKIAAVASAGGHWVQLQRLAPVWQGHDVFYVTTAKGARVDDGSEVLMVTDANRWQKWQLLRMQWQVLRILVARRPDVIITTGAAPGLAAILVGRLIGARSVWIDSIANSEQMSGSGRIARWLASVCLTQWQHLAHRGGPAHWGAVL